MFLAIILILLLLCAIAIVTTTSSSSDNMLNANKSPTNKNLDEHAGSDVLKWITDGGWYISLVSRARSIVQVTMIKWVTMFINGCAFSVVKRR